MIRKLYVFIINFSNDVISRKPKQLALLISAIGLFSLQDAIAAVSLTPPADCKFLEANGSLTVQATVSGTSNQNVFWMVDGVTGGAPAIGTITSAGVYTAPANMETPVYPTITAASVADATQIASLKVCVNMYRKPGNTYFVATTGVNTNAGTLQAPWKTIQYAVDHVNAGDTILVRSGVYNEIITVTKTGSASNGYITLTEAPGENAIIDGTGLTATGNKGLITLDNVDYWRVKGFELRNLKTTVTNFIPIGILVQNAGNRIEIRNNLIHNIEANFAPVGGVRPGALGIAIYGTSSTPLRNVIVDGNELYSLLTGNAESLTIAANTQYFQVTNNLVHDNNYIGIDAQGYYPAGSTYRAQYGWIANNQVYNLSTSGNLASQSGAAAIGIYMDGASDVTVERNNVYNAGGGVFLMSEFEGKFASNITVRNNLIRNNLSAGVLVGGYLESSGGATDSIVSNNTIYQNNQSTATGINSGEFQISWDAANIKFANNILYATDKGYVITKFSPANASTVTIGYNIYFASGGNPTRWFWIDKNYWSTGGSGSDFTAFKAISGDAGNASLVTDPSFVNAAGSDFRLAAGSPAIDSGVFDPTFGIPSVGMTDYAGNTRVINNKVDRGAYERQP